MKRIKRKRERKRARAKSMDRRGMLSENEKNFPGCPQPRKEKEGKTYHKKPIGWLAQSKKRGAKKDPLAVEDEALPMWKKPLPVKRCALQTLGGSSHSNPMSPAPLKGDIAYKMNSTKATLRKMKPYGGKMFYDKCYLSSDDEREVEEEDNISWELSPSDVTEAASAAPAATARGKKRKTADASGLDSFSMSVEKSDLGKPNSNFARHRTATGLASSSASARKSGSSRTLKLGLKG